jgi:hypothetical protein
MNVRPETRNGEEELLARIAEPLERDLVPERTEKRVDALLGARLVERRDRPFPESLVEELEGASLSEARPLEIGLGEHGFDRPVDFYAIRHAGGEATRWV